MGDDALLLNIQTRLAAQLHHNAKIVSKREASRQQTNVTVTDSSKLSYMHQRRVWFPNWLSNTCIPLIYLAGATTIFKHIDLIFKLKDYFKCKTFHSLTVFFSMVGFFSFTPFALLAKVEVSIAAVCRFYDLLFYDHLVV